MRNVRHNEAAVQGAFVALHTAGAVMFGVLAVLSGLAVDYHLRRFWREVR